MNVQNFVIGAVVLLVVAGVAGAVYKQKEKAPVVSTFEECEAAGYPVGESYPRQCWSPDGGHFVEDTEPAEEPASAASVGPGCALAGCSSIICTEADKAPDVVTTCEYREEYACYRSARCEKQPSGSCGWTQTTALSACLEASFVESKG